jgi:hypothetical protein
MMRCFAERLLALLEATRYPTTYKLATLQAVIDVAAEQTGPDGSAPESLSAKEVGRRVVELYWPQTVPPPLQLRPRAALKPPADDVQKGCQSYRVISPVKRHHARRSTPDSGRRWASRQEWAEPTVSLARIQLA